MILWALCVYRWSAMSRVRRKTMEEDSTDFEAGDLWHCSSMTKLYPVLWRGVRHPTSVCRTCLFWDSMVPHPMLTVSAQRYLVHLAVLKALGEAQVSWMPDQDTPHEKSKLLHWKPRQVWGKSNQGKEVKCKKVFFSKTFSWLTTPAFKCFNQLSGFYGFVSLLDMIIW